MLVNKTMMNLIFFDKNILVNKRLPIFKNKNRHSI